jgi:hypothetical protein
LEDVLPSTGHIDEMIITIPACGHVFTVESLDGLTGMHDFYSRDEQDMKWIGLLVPLGFIQPPVCPTCRSPITCPRYGRIVKRAVLDVLERNVAARMSHSLDKLQKQVHLVLDDNASNALLVTEAATIMVHGPEDPPNLAEQKISRNKLLETGNSPAPERDINPSNSALHFMDSKVISIWRRATHQLFTVYRDIVKITELWCANTLTQAWDASLSLLFEREIQAGLESPATVSTNSQEHAMKMAKIYIGQPRPLAYQRFLVEALWLTLHIRLTLIGLAQTWLCQVKRRRENYSSFHFHQWVIYIDLLLQTCVRDVEKACNTAKDSGSHRQIVKSRLLRMRIELEVFRFNLLMCRQYGTMNDHREDLLAMVDKFGDEAKVEMRSTPIDYFAWENIESTLSERIWVGFEFTSIARTIVNEWMEMKRSIIFYEPLSKGKQMQIVRAMNSGMSTAPMIKC